MAIDAHEIAAASSSLPLAYSERDLDRNGILSRKSRWRLRREGKFPEPIKAGSRSLYRASDIHEWLVSPENWENRREV